MSKNKVELTGVNTNNLKVLTSKETNDLFNILKNGDDKQKEKAKDLLIKGNLK